jgi:hypothetical protein
MEKNIVKVTKISLPYRTAISFDFLFIAIYFFKNICSFKNL